MEASTCDGALEGFFVIIICFSLMQLLYLAYICYEIFDDVYKSDAVVPHVKKRRMVVTSVAFASFVFVCQMWFIIHYPSSCTSQPMFLTSVMVTSSGFILHALAVTISIMMPEKKILNTLLSAVCAISIAGVACFALIMFIEYSQL